MKKDLKELPVLDVFVSNVDELWKAMTGRFGPKLKIGQKMRIHHPPDLFDNIEPEEEDEE